MEWAVGVTCTEQRLNNLLPLTLDSLRRGGFERPRLFIDGCPDPARFAHCGLECTCRHTTLGAFGNWWLAAWELYIRHPHADRYALFQDDVLVVNNLRQYLETSQYPERGYLSLILFTLNEKWCTAPGVWCEVKGRKGVGAQGLVFSRQAFLVLLGTRNDNILNKPQFRGLHATRNFDGAIAETMHTSKWPEHVHYPSLVTHIGDMTTMIGNRRMPAVPSFPGEECDALTMLEKLPTVVVSVESVHNL